MLAENQSKIEKKCRSLSKEFEKQQTKKIMGYFSHSSFDPQSVITGIVNELIDYCFRPGLKGTTTLMITIIYMKILINHEF